MRISGNDMMQGIQNIQRPYNAQTSFANASLSTDSNNDAVKADISDAGRRIGQMMDRMERLSSSGMEENMTEMKSALEELELSELDLDSMSDEEIAEVAEKIHAVMESFKPEGVQGRVVSLDSMSSDELKVYVSEFKDNASGVLDTMGKMEGMMMGRPPMGGRPPVGGKPPAGDKNQNAINAYESIDISDEEEEQLDLLELLVEALETDESSDSESDVSELQQLFVDLLSTKQQ